jgi:hypothetical protein
MLTRRGESWSKLQNQLQAAESIKSAPAFSRVLPSVGCLDSTFQMIPGRKQLHTNEPRKMINQDTIA